MRAQFDGYGYPAELVAAWCGVSLRTAAAWKSGAAKPSSQSLTLFDLHRNGRVLSERDWPGWSVRGGVLVDPDGMKSTQHQLRAYGYLIAWATDAAKLLSETGSPRAQMLGGAAPAIRPTTGRRRDFFGASGALINVL